jgi:GBP family porin
MKKHLLAVAVASAIASPAMAQNVSFYGTIGAGASQTTNSIGADVTTFDNGGEAGTGLSTNVFGFKVSEDLGGGLKLMAQFEGDLKTTTGRLGNNAQDTVDGALFNRHAYVGFSQAGLGTIKLGRTSDVIDSTEGFANFVQLFDTEAADEGGIGNKSQNSIRYDSEKLLGGLTVSVAYSNDARTPSTASATALTNQKVTSYGAVWSQGALTVGYSFGSAATTATATTNEEITTMYAGYKLGAADIRVQQTQEQTNAGLKNKTTEAAVSYALGGGLTVIGHMEKYNHSATDTTDYDQMGVMLVKDLSKRTSVYAGYRSRDLEGSGVTDVTVTSVGVRHTF